METDDYLARIGAERPAAANLPALRALLTAHLHTVPFENLSIHLGETLSLAPEALWDKIVRRRRGGFCYELNGLFAELLTALGFTVHRLAARIFTDGTATGPPLDHLALRVELAEPWLVDVGFGRFARAPLRLADPTPQSDVDGTFRIEATADGELDVYRGDDPVYRLDPRPYALADFGPMCWWQATAPESHFRRGPTCSLATADGRITLNGAEFVHTSGPTRRTETLPDDAAILACYRDRFGLPLDRVPRRPA